ncbi:unnamed protein product [Tilletia controversa]|uniref:Bola-like protein n=3 Tax=Tilletia TaxID=13289 RepID=A0A8X7MXW4_9BASI|nr:hypothetical protein CF336_g1314 [Tilletia laevis]KAE8204196.1 hypothetical protein CF328_g1223 [Tilletia controversa]KAE8264438.1 hypothetical protein A4X03_0g942 [Tilletia caries]KAE8207971.1 hypothetical protein CF335_g749 [Tilletia laevis]KAE8253119.1 hypothetical protein A4X06_0g1693 [Tilletia controversa]
MVVSSAQLEAAIRSKIDNVSTVIVSDVSGGCGQAYDVVIVSDAFEGIPTLKRHRMVNDHLKDQIAQLHAFSQTTMTTKQYTARAASSDASPTDAAAAAATPSSSLQTAPIASSKKSHGRTPSAISIPELTLTTDAAESGDGGAGGSGLASGQLTPSSSVSVVGETPAPIPQSPRISRLQLSKLQSVEFWLSLRDFLEAQFGAGAAAGAPAASPSLEAAPTLTGGRASPSRGHSPSNSISLTRARGEPEAAQVWENFFLSAKDHLSASEIARVRDVVGYTAQGGV